LTFPGKLDTLNQTGNLSKTTALKIEGTMTPADEIGSHAVQSSEADAFLGYTRAVSIVCTSANTDARNLPRTLDELGVEGISFRGTVFNGICHAGYTMDIDSIPDAPTSTLLSVVAVIQNAKLS
jgi:hypothetical protein